MKDNNIHLILAVFDGQDSAETAVQQLPKQDRNVVSAVVMQKDAAEQVTFQDIGRTPRRGAVNGVILGGVIGLLTGGTGLALGVLGGIIGHHATKKKQVTNMIPDQLGKVAGSLGPDSSALIAIGIPIELKAAVKLLCTSYNQRKIDIVKLEDGYFIQRLFTGIEPEEQTSREDKNKYGTFAYVVRDIKRLTEIRDIQYHLKIDDEEIEIKGYKCYVVNSAKAGTGLSISQKFAADDGYIDVFMLSRNRQSSSAALERFFNLDTEGANMYYWRGQEIEIDAETDQPVWTDGEYTGRTPVSMKVIPGGLTVAAP